MKKIKGKIISANENHLDIELDEALHDNYLDYEVIVEKKAKKRGLDANALSWALIDRISNSLHVSRDEVYDMMLERYGVAMYMVVKPNDADRILELMEHGRKLGEVVINGKTGIQLQIFIGSSHYNRSEFSTYLNGIISECESMGLVIDNKDVFADAIMHWAN